MPAPPRKIRATIMPNPVAHPSAEMKTAETAGASAAKSRE